MPGVRHKNCHKTVLRPALITTSTPWRRRATQIIPAPVREAHFPACLLFRRRLMTCNLLVVSRADTAPVCSTTLRASRSLPLFCTSPSPRSRTSFPKTSCAAPKAVSSKRSRAIMAIAPFTVGRGYRSRKTVEETCTGRISFDQTVSFAFATVLLTRVFLPGTSPPRTPYTSMLPATT